MKSWKKQWKAELNNAIPELDQNVLSTPVQTQPEPQLATAGANATINSGKRKTITFSAIGVAAILIITLILSFALIKPAKIPTSFSIEINPSAAFVVDEKDVVTSVTALNSDADVLFSTQENKQQIIGKTSEQAATAFVDLAFKYGYIKTNEEMAAVRFSSVTKDRLSKAITATENYLLENGFYACVFEQNLTEEEFMDLIGLNKQAGKSIEKMLEELPDLFTERQAQNKTENELKVAFIDSLTADLSFIDEIREKLDKVDNGIKEIIDVIIYEWEQSLNTIKGIVEIFGISAECYMSNVSNNIEKRSQILIEMAKNDYDLPKEPKDPQDNKDFIDNKLGGISVEDFWNGRNPRK